jgi:hypothetical protein
LFLSILALALRAFFDILFAFARLVLYADTLR